MNNYHVISLDNEILGSFFTKQDAIKFIQKLELDNLNKGYFEYNSYKIAIAESFAVFSEDSFKCEGCADIFNGEPTTGKLCEECAYEISIDNN